MRKHKLKKVSYNIDTLNWYKIKSHQQENVTMHHKTTHLHSK